MAAPTGTATTLNQVGNREGLSDILERVSPEKTPFIKNCGSDVPSKSTYFEWQTETLAAPDGTAATLEGDDTTTYTNNATTRVGNYTHIWKKPFAVSGTQSAVLSAGRKDDLNRQRMIAAIELRRDMEARLIGNYASRNQSGTDPRWAAGALAWITSNVSRGSGGSNGGFSSGTVTAATNGTQRTFAESQLKAVMQAVFTSSGEAKARVAYLSAAHKVAFSAMTGIADIRGEVKGMDQATIYGAADVFISDFGPVSTIAVAFGLTRDILIADHEYLGIAALRPIEEQKLAKTGDAEKRQMVAEKTLIVRNEKALGVIADLS